MGKIINNISILGSGWLGLPLAKHFVKKGYQVKASTRSDNRLFEITNIKAKPYIVDINALAKNIQSFLQSNILIINIPSKSVDSYALLVSEIEQSDIEHVLLVSSTSVYKNENKIIEEADGLESLQNPLIQIETLFNRSKVFKTTVLRFGGLIGKDRNPANFFKQGKSIQAPDAYVNLIHQDDCIGIINQVIKQDVWGDTFNCCADTHPTKREFYTHVAIASSLDIPSISSADSVSFKIISNQKVKQALNYEFIHGDLMRIKW